MLAVLRSYITKFGNDGQFQRSWARDLSRISNVRPATITARILDRLIEFGFIDELGEDDWLRFADWHDYQPIDATSAERVRRSRQKRYETSYRDEGELGKVLRIELPEAS